MKHGILPIAAERRKSCRSTGAGSRKGSVLKTEIAVVRRKFQAMKVEGGPIQALRFSVSRERGQSLAEYGLILLLVIGVAVVVLALFGNRLLALFTQIVNAF